MKQIGLNKKRRAVGSIIAGAFLVLIILSGYTFFQSNNKAQSDYQEIITTMNEKDISRKQEKLEILGYEPYLIAPNTLKLVVKVVNNGPEAIVLKYSAVFLGGEVISDETGGEYFDIVDDVTGENIVLPPSGETVVIIQRTRPLNPPDDPLFDRYADYIIHVVTEKGNIFSLRENDIPAIIINEVMSSVAEVIGEFLPKYTAFNWGSLDSNGVLELDPGWVHSFVIHKDHIGNGYIFSITGRWYGTNSIILSSDTVLKFEAIEGPESEKMCYIVYYSPLTLTAESYTGNEIELPAFDLESQELPAPITLYFAAGIPGGDPSSSDENFDKNSFKKGDSYQIKLGFFDIAEGYAQTFPLQVLVVED